jgi:hypothetical protein
MSGERWVSPSQRMQRDPRRQALLDEYLTLGVHRAQWPSGARVTFGEYAEMRVAGRWNEFAEETGNQRFKVEE